MEETRRWVKQENEERDKRETRHVIEQTQLAYRIMVTGMFNRESFEYLWASKVDTGCQPLSVCNTSAEAVAKDDDETSPKLSPQPWLSKEPRKVCRILSTMQPRSCHRDAANTAICDERLASEVLNPFRGL